VRLSYLEHRVGNVETAVMQLQSAWSYYQTTLGGPSTMSGYGISPGAGPSPGFGYQQYTSAYNFPPPGFYSQSATDWSYMTNQRTPTPESYQRPAVPPASDHPTVLPPSANPPQLIPVSSSSDRIYMPSTAIDKTSLRDVAVVVAENKQFQKKDKITTLCQILARECFFGKNLMSRCTAGGKGSFGLPRDEMNELKKTMFELFPAYKDCPEEFEPLWEECVTSMGNACRRYRNMAEKKQQQPK